MGFRRLVKTFFYCSLLLSAGCATTGMSSNNTRFADRGIIGFAWTVENNQIKIIRVAPNSAADKAGLLQGDIIVGYDNILIGNSKSARHQFAQKLRNSPNTSIQLRLLRGNEELNTTAHIHSTRGKAIDPIIDAVLYLVTEGEPVRIAILVTEISNSLPGTDLTSPQGIAWTKAIRQSNTTDTEQGLLTAFSDHKNFTLIDRGDLEKYFQEFRLQMSGAIDASTAKKLGMLSGASHLYTISFHRSAARRNHILDFSSHRLLEVETGTVLGSASFRDEFKP